MKSSPQTVPTRRSGQENYLASVSDLMAGLSAIFIVLMVAFALMQAVQHQANQEEIQRIRARIEKREAMLSGMKSELQGLNIRVDIDPAAGILRLPEAVLFQEGMADLPPQGIHLMGKIAASMASYLKDKGYAEFLETVLVEGHSDNKAIQGTYFDGVGTAGSNWDLSYHRAKQAYDALRRLEPKLRTLKNRTGKDDLLGLSVYANLRPIASNATADGRKKNRRIDVRFVIESISMTQGSSSN